MSQTALCNLLYGQVCCWQCILSKWPSFERKKTNNSCPFPTPAAPTELSPQVILAYFSKTRTWTDKSNSPEQSHWNPAIKDSFGDKRPTDLYRANQRFTQGETHKTVCCFCVASWGLVTRVVVTHVDLTPLSEGCACVAAACWTYLACPSWCARENAARAT